MSKPMRPARGTVSARKSLPTSAVRKEGKGFQKSPGPAGASSQRKREGRRFRS